MAQVKESKVKVLKVHGCDGCGTCISEETIELSPQTVDGSVKEDPENFFLSEDLKRGTIYRQWIGQTRCRYC